jgi:ABC-type siderophore export system fused ATPase/permease subunit
MPLIQLVIVLVVVGVVLWVINSYIPMQSTIKAILNVVVILVVIVWLLSVFGFIGKLSTIPHACESGDDDVLMMFDQPQEIRLIPTD